MFFKLFEDVSSIFDVDCYSEIGVNSSMIVLSLSSFQNEYKSY
jgi:hypothetical protein